MKLINAGDASRQLGVAIATIHRWAKQNRIRVTAYIGDMPGFTQEALDEVKPEVKKYGKPAIKDGEQLGV